MTVAVGSVLMPPTFGSEGEGVIAIKVSLG